MSLWVFRGEGTLGFFVNLIGIGDLCTHESSLCLRTEPFSYAVATPYNTNSAPPPPGTPGTYFPFRCLLDLSLDMRHLKKLYKIK